jgi:hypothetical protein
MQDTKYNLLPGKVHIHDLPKEYAGLNGIAPMPAIIDLIVGEEVGLYWFDRTPFVRDLAAVRPFQLFLKTGAFRSDFGPLMWLLFYVPDPKPGPQPFAATECFINPANTQMMKTWRKLANQSHWHLTLVDANDEAVDFFEIENVFGLGEALDSMERCFQGMPVIDFNLAKQEFYERYSLDDLIAMS